MPAVYAHRRFGEEVLAACQNDEARTAIESYPDLFRIGLQGPDILFYYDPLRKNPYKAAGDAIHDAAAAPFFAGAAARVNGRVEGQLLFSYLLGFLCHFALDSEGHLLNDKIYKNVWGLYGGYFCVNKSDGTWCWLDKQGNECFDGGYTTVGSFSEGLAFAGKNGKYIYIDTSGNKAFDVPNSGGELYGGMFNDGIAYIIKNDKQWGCIDKTGTVIVPYELDTQDDVAKLLSDRYSIKKEPLKRRDIELYNLYKNRTKCSIFDTLAEDMWGY